MEAGGGGGGGGVLGGGGEVLETIRRCVEEIEREGGEVYDWGRVNCGAMDAEEREVGR